MRKIKTSVLIGGALLILSGCTIFPGTHLSTSDKNKVEDEQSETDYSAAVNVYALTPQTVAEYQVKKAGAQSNP
jgi:polysaccharide export outer membrane protein